MNQHAAEPVRLTGRTRVVTVGGRSPFAQGVILFFMALLALLMLPLLLIAMLAVLLIGGRAALSRGWRALRAPNGMLDGRRNVRVRVPSNDQPNA